MTNSPTNGGADITLYWMDHLLATVKSKMLIEYSYHFKLWDTSIPKTKGSLFGYIVQNAKSPFNIGLKFGDPFAWKSMT